MKRIICIAAGLALSTDTAAQGFNLTPHMDALAVTTSLQLQPTPHQKQPNVEFPQIPIQKPFPWKVFGAAVFTTTVVLVAMYATDSDRESPEESPQ